jgi:multiple sugar transport system substrate-binding protein
MLTSCHDRGLSRRLRARRSRSVFAALILLLGLGCGRGEGGTVVEFWALGREGEYVRALVADFEARNAGVSVRVQQIPWSAAHEKLLTAFVGDALPDVIQLGNTWIPEFAALGALEPLEPWLAETPALERADFFPGLLDATEIDGNTLALPWYADTRLLFYRSDWFARDLPGTWPAWVDEATRVQARLAPGQHALLLPLGEWEVPVILALQHGAALLRDGDRYGNFRSPEFRAAFAFYLSLFERGLAPHTGVAQLANLHQDFAAGAFGALVTGPWNLREFAARLPPELQGSWATAPLPAVSGDAPGVSLAGGASLGLVARSRHKQAAWAWMAYLAEPARQATFQRLSGDLPARRSAWDDVALQGPRIAAFRTQLAHAVPTPKLPEWERIASRIAWHAEAAVREGRDLDAVLAALDADADQALAKRRSLLARRERGE